MAVTKEVWGKNTNVGAKKADMIAEINLYVCADEAEQQAALCIQAVISIAILLQM